MSSHPLSYGFFYPCQIYRLIVIMAAILYSASTILTGAKEQLCS